MDQIHLEMQRQAKEQSALKSAKRTGMFIVVAGIGGAITFASIILPRSPDGIGIFLGALAAGAGVLGAFVNTRRTIRCLKRKPPGSHP